MSLNQIANFAGLPSGKKPTSKPTSKPTRRGGRSGRGSIQGSIQGIKVHTDNANAAHAAGDHTAARSHLFKAIGALRQSATAPAGQPSVDPDDGGPAPVAAVAPATPAKPSGSSVLAGLLRGRKK